MLSFAIRMLTKQKITLVLASSVDVVPKIHPTSRFRSVLNSFHWQLSFHCNLSYWHLLSHGQFSSGWTYIELFTDTAFVPWPVILRTKRPGFKQNNKFVGKWQSFIEGGKYIGLLHTAHLMGNSTSRQMVWIMGFPLPPPVIANFSVDDTEERALAQAAHKPLSWFRYVDDNFVIWPLESEKLENFFFFWPSEWPAQEYTIHRGYRNRLPPQFSGIDVYRRPGGSLDHQIFRKPTHTKPYLSPGSHHPSYIQAVLLTLVHRARTVCDNLHEELDFLKTTFWENGYNTYQIRRALILAVRTYKSQEKPTSVALLPYVRTTYGRPSRMLAKLNIKWVGLPPRKISSLFRHVKDDLGLRTPGVYGHTLRVGSGIHRTDW